jgi:predicted polyphosphate/ATP-dependent NAD kinase
MVSVGVIANPASGRDIRRLVAGASVFDNAEKGSMVYRLLAGLGAVGVGQVWMMPAGGGLSSSLVRNLRGRTDRNAQGSLPALDFLDMPLHGDARDSVRAAEELHARGVKAIVVLGGDGTHRVVAQGCRDLPLCAMSTGTNNAFPELREATVAGIATGLVATGQVQGFPNVRRAKRFDVRVGDLLDTALVDVVASGERFIGARALWRADDLSGAFVTFATPTAVGISGVAGQVAPVERDAPHGLFLRLGPLASAEEVVLATLAPGLVVRVGVSGVRRIGLGESTPLEPADGSLALDGERELERSEADTVTVTLVRGPFVIDVDAVMACSVARGLVRQRGPRRVGGR